MAGRTKRNSRKARKARAQGYHPAVVVRGQQARHLQMLADNEEFPGEIQLDPALIRKQNPLGYYFAATIAVVLSATLALTEVFKR